MAAEEPVSAIEKHRDDLEELAAGDNPAAWVAAELLEAAEGSGGDRR